MIKKRNSSFELLRIIAMLLIIASHYRTYGGYHFHAAELNFSSFFINSFEMFGSASCGIFALITGYFMINTNTKEKYYRRILPLLGEFYFYHIVIFCLVKYTGIVEIETANILEAFLPLSYGNWYVVYYFLLFMIIPFINPALNNMDKKTYSRLVLTLIIIWSVINTLTMHAWKYSELDFFVVMYVLGGYIRLHLQKSLKYKNCYNLLIALGFAILSLLSEGFIDMIALKLSSDYLFVNSVYMAHYSSITSVGFALFMVLYFSNIEFYNPLVNIVGKTTIGVYLIHDNTLMVKPIWQYWWSNIDYVNNPYFHLFAKVVIVFVVCSLIDIVREYTLGRVFNSFIYKHIDTIKDKMIKLTPITIRKNIL